MSLRTRSTLLLAVIAIVGFIVMGVMDESLELDLGEVISTENATVLNESLSVNTTIVNETLINVTELNISNLMNTTLEEANVTN